MGLKMTGFKRIIWALKEKSGAEMAEAAISLPLIILTAMLLLRTFVFYLEILSSSVNSHIEALEITDDYSGIGFQVYQGSKEVTLLKGGVLLFDVKKEIDTKVYMLNEDLMVRAGEVFK